MPLARRSLRSKISIRDLVLTTMFKKLIRKLTIASMSRVRAQTRGSGLPSKIARTEKDLASESSSPLAETSSPSSQSDPDVNGVPPTAPANAPLLDDPNTSGRAARALRYQMMSELGKALPANEWFMWKYQRIGPVDVQVSTSPQKAPPMPRRWMSCMKGGTKTLRRKHQNADHF